MDEMIRRTKLDTTWLVLKYAYGFVLFVAGLDKFFGYLIEWRIYVGQFAIQILPIGVTNLLYLIGISQIIVGVLILSKFTRLGVYILMVGLAIMIINLLAVGGQMEIVLRDVLILTGAWALAQLTEIKEG